MESHVAQVCLARQPIFDSRADVIGYELLYGRPEKDTATTGVGFGVISADVIVHAWLNIGLEQLTSGRTAYLDFTREMLLSRAYTLLPREKVVIELLETVVPDEDVVTACEDLVAAGYTLALDDVAWSAEYRRLLELASVVKVDVLHQTATQLDEVAQRLASYDVRLLADRVATNDVRAMCTGLGYTLFQGDYFARLELVKTQALVSDEVTIVHAMNVMCDPRTTDSQAEAALTSDLGLSHKFLRLVNSPARGDRGIESIRHALQVRGRDEIGKWLALLLISSIAARAASNRELLHLAVQRGRMCELLAAPSGRERDAGSLFLVGLFSLLDAISGVPIAQLLESIALAPALRDALVARTGPYGDALSLAEAYEQGQWASVRRQVSSSGIATDQVGQIYVESMAWTREQLLALGMAS